MIQINSEFDAKRAELSLSNQTYNAAATQKTGESDNSPSTRSLRDMFHHFSHFWAGAMGSAWAFVIALLVIFVWAVTGPIFGFSDTWQLVINTGTTIVTFLMVFLIQNTQNRDARALHLKLDELLRAITMARTDLVDLENLSEEELDKLEREFKAIREKECQKT